ncbi:odorant receptor 59a-like [Drosophila subpulchrella]|uniref:odorant receptor 59a-like n=1 Tax=Drosophila subpulchrella TaxID=1486046 RepID=UPI0018A19797|nr:odorant receptor 59a-like [Drosophila subpulchrella]
MSTINSLSYFQSHRFVLKILCFDPDQLKTNRKFYFLTTIAVSLVFTFGYPFHLGMNLFRNETTNQDMMNLAAFLPCLGSSLKFSIYALNYGKVRRMEELLKMLDERVIGLNQKSIYAKVRWHLRLVLYTFIGAYTPCGLTAAMMFLFAEEWGLMLPGWFPFDWGSSLWIYCLVLCYQVTGLSYQLLQNYISDCFPSVVLCLISSHTQMLYCRFEEIGLNSIEDAEKELERCITDHKNLLELFKITETFMSLPMAIQFSFSAFTSSFGIASLFFFANEPMVRAYYICYLIAMIVQIFPCCYFGTDSEFWLGRLHYAAFSCDWIGRERTFKRKLMLFVERSLKSNKAMACGMLPIAVGTFFATLKFAYSLLMIILQRN